MWFLENNIILYGIIFVLAALFISNYIALRRVRNTLKALSSNESSMRSSIEDFSKTSDLVIKAMQKSQIILSEIDKKEQQISENLQKMEHLEKYTSETAKKTISLSEGLGNLISQYNDIANNEKNKQNRIKSMQRRELSDVNADGTYHQRRNIKAPSAKKTYNFFEKISESD